METLKTFIKNKRKLFLMFAICSFMFQGFFIWDTTFANGGTSFETATLISDLDTAVPCSVNGDYVYYKFVPNISGRYAIRSKNHTNDPEAELYVDNGSGTPIYVIGDDDSGNNLDFYILSSLIAGKIYYIRAHEYQMGSGSYDIYISRYVAVTGTPDENLNENNLDGRTITLELEGETFENSSLSKSNFTLTNAPAGTAISGVSYTDDTHADVTISYDGTDFDSYVTNMTITVDAVELSGTTSLTTGNIGITATADVESIAITDDGSIIEGAEDGEKITVTLTGGEFASSLTEGNWTVSNLPSGVTLGSLNRVSDTVVEITLSGNTTEDYNSNKTNVTVSITGDEYNEGTVDLSDSDGVTLTAKTTGTVTTKAVDTRKATSVNANGEVTDDGNVTITERGVVYSKSSDPTTDDTKVKDDGTSVGSFSVKLTGLDPNTTYHVRAYVINEEGTAYGADKTFATLNRTVAGTPDEALTESNLDESVITIELTNETFKDSDLDKANFTLTNAPAGTAISGVSYTDDTHANVTISYDGTDFDSDVTDMTVKIASSELTDNLVLETGNIEVTATADDEAIAIADDGSIIEAAEDGEKITVTLTGGTFVSTLNDSNWTVSNLPAGVTLGSLNRVSDTKVEITLSGNSTEDYNSNKTNVTVSITGDEYNEGTVDLSDSDGVTLTAKTTGTVTTKAIDSTKATSVNANGEVTDDGNGTITERGVVYSKSSDPTTDDTKVKDDGTSVGSFSVKLTGLDPNTTYHVRAYVINEKGTAYGADKSFKTLNRTVAGTPDEALTESNLDESVITIELTNETFKDSTLDKTNFTLTNAPIGVSIKEVNYLDSERATITLSYDGTDFDSDVTDMTVKIASSELTDNLVLETGNIEVTATADDEAIAIADDGSIIEAAEDGEKITVTLTGGTFVSTLNDSNWTVSNLPAGVTLGSLNRVSDTKVEITLSGNSTEDYNSNKTNVTVSITGDEYNEGTVDLSDSDGVTLTAKTTGTVTTKAIDSTKATSVNANGEVTDDGNGTITERGVVYSKSSDPTTDDTKVKDDGTSVGSFSVKLTGLDPNTTYHVRAYVINEKGTAYGADKSFKTLNRTVAGTPDEALTESNLDESVITIELTNETFKDSTLDKTNFTLTNAPIGVSIKEVNYLDSERATITLSYDGTDFDSDVTDMTVKIASSELTDNLVLETGNIEVTATADDEAIAIADDGSIIEGAEDGEKITVTLTGGEFASSLTDSNWTVSNLPTGVTLGSLNRVSDTKVEITLSGNSTEDYNSNKTNVTVSITGDEYNEGTVDLSDSDGVTLTAKTTGTVTTKAIDSTKATSVKIHGEVTDDGNGTITERGVVYSKSSDPTTDDTKVKDDGTSVGSFSVKLTGLDPNTTYHVRAYVINEEGTSYGADKTFATLNRTVAGTPDEALTESNLDESVITIELTNETFKDSTLDKTNFTLTNAPIGVSIKEVNYLDSERATITLSYDGTDFDSDVTDMTVKIASSELTDNLVLETGNIEVTATADDEAIAIADDGSIIEAAEDGEKITVTLTGGTFVSTLNDSNWTVSNLPAGVTLGSLNRVSDTKVEITLSGNTTEDYDSDITNVTVTITGDEYNEGTVSLSDSDGVTLEAKTTGTVGSVSIKDIGKYDCELEATVENSGKGTIIERGVLYSDTTDSPKVDDGKSEKITVAGTTGAMTVVLKNLEPNEKYYTRGYVTNEEGTSYGKVKTFTTDNTYMIKEISNQVMTTVKSGYVSGSQETKAVTIENTGTGDLENVIVSLKGLKDSNFQFKGLIYGTTTQSATTASGTQTTTGSITTTAATLTFDLDKTTRYATVLLSAKDGLGKGTYKDTINITADGMENYSFTVTQVIGDPDTVVITDILESDGSLTIYWSPMSTATSYNIYDSREGTLKLIEKVSQGTYSYKIENLTNGETYKFIVKAETNKDESTPSNEVSGRPKRVPRAPRNVKATAGSGYAEVEFEAPLSDGGRAITEYIITVYPGEKQIRTSELKNIVRSLTNETTYYFEVQGVNEVGIGDVSARSEGVTPRERERKDDDRPSSGGKAPNNTNVEKDTGTSVLVNGKEERAATSKNTIEEGKKVITVTVDSKKIEEKLALEGNGSKVAVPVKENADKIIGRLNGQVIKNMENKEAIFEIQTNNVSYTLPARQINIDKISEEIGKTVALEDIEVSVEIEVSNEETVKIIEDTAKDGGYALVVNPVKFEVKCTNEEKTVSVTKFSGYVERKIAIPEGIDPSKVTTGVVLNSDGTFSHVPTKIVEIDGKYYAEIKSLTNSDYTVIYNEMKFNDIKGHWAEEAINDMGSRLIISGVGDNKFEPEREITRGEFSTIIVRALGLMRTGEGIAAFEDVSSDKWFYDGIGIASTYDLISGYGNGKFGPNDMVTREQAMVIIGRAMKVAGIEETHDMLDVEGASEWAKAEISKCISSGIMPEEMNGLDLKGDISRGEVAAMVRLLLEKADLI